MIRLANYTISALIILMLMGSREDGGMMYACYFALAAQGRPSLIADEAPTSKIVDLRTAPIEAVASNRGAVSVIASVPAPLWDNKTPNRPVGDSFARDAMLSPDGSELGTRVLKHGEAKQSVPPRNAKW